MFAGVGATISAAPLFQRAQSVGVATNPGLRLHVATTLAAALGIFDERWTGFTGVESFVPGFSGYLAEPNGLSSCLRETGDHIHLSGLHLGSMLPLIKVVEKLGA